MKRGTEGWLNQIMVVFTEDFQDGQILEGVRFADLSSISGRRFTPSMAQRGGASPCSSRRTRRRSLLGY